MVDVERYARARFSLSMRPSKAAGKVFKSGAGSALAILSGSGMSSGSLHRFMMRSEPTFVVIRSNVFLRSIKRPSSQALSINASLESTCPEREASRHSRSR